MIADRGGAVADDPAGPAASGPGAEGRLATKDASTRQPPLPLPWHLIRPREQGDFAHPAERDFSRILTYYRVRWVYEPTTFALAWTADGRPSEMFTPDFYLPDFRLYIELTTMRQRLVTRKNRKLRRLRELYPSVRIKLLYRRDYHRLLDAYRPRGHNGIACDAGEVLFDERQIRERIAEIADALVPALHGSEPTIALTIGKGARVFGDTMTDQLQARGVAIERDGLRLTRFRTSGGVRPVRVSRPPRGPLQGRSVLVLTDVVSTGLSLSYLTTWLRRRGAARIEICTLLDRREARLVDLPIQFAGFEAPNEPLIGFGLHLHRQFSDLPYIARLEIA